MNIKDLLQDDALKALEDQIIMSFEGFWSKDHNYTDERSLIEVRKNIINHRVLQYQDLLLPDIIAFNDAMREALREMFDKAHAVYEANKGFGEDVEVEACCYLSNNYPALHPVQGEDRQDLWNALKDPRLKELKDTILNYLEKHIVGDTIDYVVATHADKDHIGSFPAIFKKYEI